LKQRIAGRNHDPVDDQSEGPAIVEEVLTAVGDQLLTIGVSQAARSTFAA
jgi:hypothetical protein